MLRQLPLTLVRLLGLCTDIFTQGSQVPGKREFKLVVVVGIIGIALLLRCSTYYDINGMKRFASSYSCSHCVSLLAYSSPFYGPLLKALGTCSANLAHLEPDILRE